MAIKLMTREWCKCTHDYRHEYIVDSDADFTNLPAGGTGSTAVSIESGKVMVVNTEGKWVEFGVPSGGGSDSIVGTWRFNETLTRACPQKFNIAFTTNNNLVDGDGTDYGNSFVAITTPYATVIYIYYGEGNTDYLEAIGFGGFSNGFDGIIHITGGDDTKNEYFVAWLKENATKVG